MFCAQCGTQLPENAKFCPECGQNLDAQKINMLNQENAVEVKEKNVQKAESICCPTCGSGNYKRSVKSGSGIVVFVCQNCGREFRDRQNMCKTIQYAKKFSYCTMIVCGVLACLTGWFSSIGNTFWILGLITAAIFLLGVRNVLKRDVGLSLKKFLSETESAEIKKSTQKLKVATIAIYVLYVVIWCMNYL